MAVTCICCETSVEWWVRLRSHPDLAICHDCLGGLNGQRHGQLQLIAGSWLVMEFEPIFKVADVARSVVWFERAGFAVSFHDDAYAFVHRDLHLTIHLAQAEGNELPGQGSALPPLSRMLTKWPRNGEAPRSTWSVPRNEDYGKREGSVIDPDGNVIRFGSPIR